MKNLFSSVLDKRTGTEEFYGEPFITNRIDVAQEQEIAQRRAEIDSFEKKRGVPVWYTALEYLALLAFLFCFLFMAGRLKEASFAEVYGTYPAVFYGGIGCLVLWGVLSLLERIRKKRAADSEELRRLEQATNETVRRSEHALDIPAGAKRMDVLSAVLIRKKNGKERPYSLRMSNYINLEQYVYCKDGCLCFSDLYSELSVPLSALSEIRRVDKSVNFMPWNKEEGVRSPAYPPYRLKMNAYGAVFCKPYYSLPVRDERGEFEILFCSYELDSLNALLNLPVRAEAGGDGEQGERRA